MVRVRDGTRRTQVRRVACAAGEFGLLEMHSGPLCQTRGGSCAEEIGMTGQTERPLERNIQIPVPTVFQSLILGQSSARNISVIYFCVAVAGDGTMFGFKRRAREQAARDEAELKSVRQTTLAQLIAELRDTVQWLAVSHNLGERKNLLLSKAERIREGIDAVLVTGVEAFGPALRDQDNLVRGGAMLANGIRNLLLLTGKFDRAQARGDICYLLGFARDGAERDKPTEYYEGFKQGQEIAQAITDAVDNTMRQNVTPWSGCMIEMFKKKVTVKVLFSDNNLGLEAQSVLAEFAQAIDDHLEAIKPDTRANLSYWEQLSREMGALDMYDILFSSRFDVLRQNMIASATEIANCVVVARNAELGRPVENSDSLAHGRQILEDVRSMPVSLTEDQKGTLKACSETLE